MVSIRDRSVQVILGVLGVLALAVGGFVLLANGNSDTPAQDETATTIDPETVVDAPEGVFQPGDSVPQETSPTADPQRCAAAAASVSELLEQFPDPAAATSAQLDAYSPAVHELVLACDLDDQIDVRVALGEWLAGRSFRQLVDDPTTPPPDLSHLNPPRSVTANGSR